jgi:hypothetical protein
MFLVCDVGAVNALFVGAVGAVVAGAAGSVKDVGSGGVVAASVLDQSCHRFGNSGAIGVGSNDVGAVGGLSALEQSALWV